MAKEGNGIGQDEHGDYVLDSADPDFYETDSEKLEAEMLQELRNLGL